jgi:hypothetical protein
VFETGCVENLRKSHAQCTWTALAGAEMGRDEIYTKSVAVGSENFVRKTYNYFTNHLDIVNASDVISPSFLNFIKLVFLLPPEYQFKAY